MTNLSVAGNRCDGGGVGGRDRDEDQHEPHDERPEGEPVRARTDTLDGAARRAPAVDVERSRNGGSGNRAAPDLDRAAAGRRGGFAVAVVAKDGGGVNAAAVAKASVGVVVVAKDGGGVNAAVMAKASVGVGVGVVAKDGVGDDVDVVAASRRRHVGLAAAALRRGGGLRVDSATVTARTSRSQLGAVGAAACFVGALGGIAEILDVRPPRAAPRL